MAIAVLAATALSGCGSFDRFASFEAWSGKTKTPDQNQPAAVAPTELVGRWTLSSPGHGQCVLIFGDATAGTAEGSIAPEGGCPGQFFTSRKWTYENSGLVIRDHNGEPLARLTMAGSKFDGLAASGEPVALIR